MSTFTDFQRTHTGEKARVRRLYWVHGEEETLRLEVVARVREMAGALPFNTLTLDAGEIPESEIWAHLNQHPLGSEQKRLVVVHRAEHLVHLDRLTAWAKDRSRNAVAVFESSDPDLVHPEQAVLSKSSSAMVVHCTLPKAPDARLRRAIEIVQSWGNIDPVTASVLVKRVNFDMAEARAFMRKVSLFPAVRERGVSAQVVYALAPRRVEEEVIWALIACNKRAAVEAVTEGEVNVPLVIATLAAHIETLSLMNALLTSTTGIKDMAYKMEAREHHIRMLFPYAGLYPRREAVRRTLLLTRLDKAPHEGLLEALIALW